MATAKTTTKWITVIAIAPSGQLYERLVEVAREIPAAHVVCRR